MLAITATAPDLLPALLFNGLVGEMDFDPFAHNPLFDTPIILPPLDEQPFTMRSAFEHITGTEYGDWVSSDAAAMLAFLTRDDDCVDGIVVSVSYDNHHDA